MITEELQEELVFNWLVEVAELSLEDYDHPDDQKFWCLMGLCAEWMLRNNWGHRFEELDD